MSIVSLRRGRRPMKGRSLSPQDEGRVMEVKEIYCRGKQLLHIFGVFALSLAFAFTAMTALGVALKDERQLSPWGTGFFYIASGSMDPVLPVGSLVWVNTVSPDKIKVNDVLTFFAANGRDIVTHRVREVSLLGDHYLFTTRGDANNTDDPPLAYNRVIGRVWVSIAGIGFLTGFVQDVKYVGASIIGVGVVLCAFGVWTERSGKKNEEQ